MWLAPDPLFTHPAFSFCPLHFAMVTDSLGCPEVAASLPCPHSTVPGDQGIHDKTLEFFNGGGERFDPLNEW